MVEEIVNENQIGDEAVDNEVVSSIEQEISKLDEIEKQKLMAKLTAEKTQAVDTVKQKYEQELKELQNKYNVSQQKEKQSSDYVIEIDKKVEELSKKFENTWKQYQPERTGLSNTSSNPFKGRSPEDVLSELKDPRDWHKNPDLKKKIFQEFLEQIERR